MILLECVKDIFYEWYKSNSTLFNKVDLDDYEIENIAIGDVTKSAEN
jgi:hypothetical protein